jgi:acyl-CoA dehydrogenase
MEVHGGLGVLAEYGAERWLREAMILAIWEGTSHRQILDGLEVMERKQAHKLLFQRLAEIASSKELQDLEREVEQHLRLPQQEKEALAEPLFRKLAALTAETLARKSK